MASLSILIPVRDSDQAPRTLVEALASNKADFEIVVVAEDQALADRLGLADLATIDSRARLAIPESRPKSALSLWNFAVKSAHGDWVTLIRPNDIVEPDALYVAEFAKGKLGQADAIGWNLLSVSADAEPGKSNSVAIPTQYDISDLDKTRMLQAFFFWENAGLLPKMPFGLYHGVLSRATANVIADSIAASGREHDLAQWEWAARAVLVCEKLVFIARPLSVADATPYTAPKLPIRTEGFPFHAGIGLVAGIAEIQWSLFREMGADWSGAQEGFVRSCIYDCMNETDPQAFNAKCNAYFNALKLWEGGQHAGLFRPQYLAEKQLDTRRGLHGNVLMIDRHIAGARDAQEFYKVVRNFLVPIGLICASEAA